MVKVLIQLLLLAGIGYGSAAQIRLEPKGQGSTASDKLITRYTRRTETTVWTYLVFDLSGQGGSFKSIKFRIFGKTDSTAKLVDVYSAFGSWTGRPSRVNFIGSFEVSSVDKERELDITPYVNAIGKKEIILVLVEREQQRDGGVSYFHSPSLSLEGGGVAFKPVNNTYYVDAVAGNDRAAGTSPATAWKTLAKVESTFLLQGDQVLFKKGSVFKGSLFLKIIPSSTKVTKIGAYGSSGDRPVLDAEGKESFCLMFFNTPFIEVSDLTITQTAKDIPAIRRGIYYQAEDMGEVPHVQFRNLNIENIVGNKGKDDGDLYAKRNAGLSLEITGNNTPTYMNGYLVEGCRFYRLGRHGAVNQSTWSKRTLTTNTNWVPSKNVVFRRNVFEETMSDGLIVRVADAPLMEYNLFKRCSIELSGNASFTFNCDNALWQYNEACYTVYNTGDSDAAGFDSDYKSKGTIFQYNYAHHNEYGDILITGGPASAGGFNDGTIVRYNVFYNNGHHGIRLSGMVSNSKCYNNVIYKDQGVARPTERYEEYTTNRLFYTKNWGGWPKDGFYANNIYYYVHDSVPASTDLNPDKSPGSRFFNNIIYANKIVSYPEEVGGLRVDPMIKLPDSVKNWEGLSKMRYFRSGPGSPAIGAGMRIDSTKSGATDIGAFER
ncbi:MAG: right-handed parallel beta-helix repeat-containing protein [Bacteroidetes bacterium]|nr:right-handed parallel beta-helix repeat-containing protein [Bacteroidota bacterium]